MGTELRNNPPTLATVPDAVEALAHGEMVIVVDSCDRENEGDLVMAAEHITPDAVNFMATHGRGLICVPMLAERLEELGIPPMVSKNSDPLATAFHISVDHAEESSTGISASDRANTIRGLASDTSTPATFHQPGHVFPLACRSGGVLRRAGHTEASVDLVTLAGLSPAAVICEISGSDGEMARLPALLRFADEHGLLVMAISDLIAYRRRTESLVTRVSSARMPLMGTDFLATGYRDTLTGVEHIALTLGDVTAGSPLVRVHSECLTGDVFGSQRCDCGQQLRAAVQMIVDQGAGAIVYLRGHEGRGIGLLDKLRAYSLQDTGLDTVEANLALGRAADERDYGIGMQILTKLGVGPMRLMTNNPAKRAGLEAYGLTIVERVALIVAAEAENVRYLRTKKQKLGHLLDATYAESAEGTQVFG